MAKHANYTEIRPGWEDLVLARVDARNAVERSRARGDMRPKPETFRIVRNGLGPISIEYDKRFVERQRVSTFQERLQRLREYGGERESN